MPGERSLRTVSARGGSSGGYQNSAAASQRSAHVDDDIWSKPRDKTETPYEYLETLHQAFPASEKDLTIITEAYVNAHYGEVPDSHEELQRIRDCWERARERESKGRTVREGD